MSAELFIHKSILPFLLWLAFCAILLWIILEACKRMRKPTKSAPVPTDGFAEFYRDLRRCSKGVNFTHEEAASLHRWEQRWAGEGRKIEKSQETL